jgi:hypothetical protein
MMARSELLNEDKEPKAPSYSPRERKVPGVGGAQVRHVDLEGVEECEIADHGVLLRIDLLGPGEAFAAMEEGREKRGGVLAEGDVVEVGAGVGVAGYVVGLELVEEVRGEAFVGEGGHAGIGAGVEEGFGSPVEIVLDDEAQGGRTHGGELLLVEERRRRAILRRDERRHCHGALRVLDGCPELRQRLRGFAVDAQLPRPSEAVPIDAAKFGHRPAAFFRWLGRVRGRDEEAESGEKNEDTGSVTKQVREHGREQWERGDEAAADLLVLPRPW